MHMKITFGEDDIRRVCLAHIKRMGLLPVIDLAVLTVHPGDRTTSDYISLEVLVEAPESYRVPLESYQSQEDEE